MMHATRLWIALAMLASLGSCSARENRETPARREARRLYLEGVDHALRLEYGAAVYRLRDAMMADPGYLPALSDLWLELSHSSRVAAMLDTVAARATDPGLARCLLRAAAVYRGVQPTLPPPRGRESVDARYCSFYVDRYLERPTAGARATDSALVLADAYPESPSFTSVFTDIVNSSGDRSAVEAAIRRTMQLPHGVARTFGLANLANIMHERGEDSTAAELERYAMHDPDWTLPGFRAAWAGQLTSHVSLRALNERPDPSTLLRHVDSIVVLSSALRHDAMSAGDQHARLSLQVTLGVEALDRGQLDVAVQMLGASLPLVDSLRDAGLRAYVYMRYGRALVKAGRAPEAEHVLQSARSIGADAALPRIQKEVEHNLLHLYEALGMDSAAQHAGEEFVRFASMGPLDPVRMMSARDLGMFLRARGLLGESRQSFDRMLAAIDTLGHWTYYAGEYYELTGAVDEALAAYTAAASRQEEPVRALAGLVRVALAMGDTAAARRWATVHDRRRDGPGRPEAHPLLPSVIRKTVGGTPARLAFEDARAEVARHGQVSAWASLTTDLAALEYDLGNFSRAAFLADSGVNAATRVGAFETALRSRALGAAAGARVATGTGIDRGIARLAALASDADRRGGVLVRTEIRRMMAGVLASHGRWRDAMAEYRRAVIPLDSVAGQIAMDPGQAAFRSAQRSAYDEALRTIVQNSSDPAAVNAYATWSARRKGRTYAVRLPTAEEGGVPRPAAGTAIIDYVILDSLVAVLVVTGNRTTIVAMDVNAKDVRSDVAELRANVDLRVGSSIDVRRARFPLSVAHRLYRSLLEPLEPLVKDARTLVIVPDGILSLVPFDALVVAMPASPDDFAGARYVLDGRVVVNVTTIGTEPSAWHVSAKRLTIIDPGNAPDAALEVDAIAATLPEGAVTALRGQRATRARTIDAMKTAALVHFVAHAEANEHDPGSSRVQLSPENGDDGYLGAAEVAALRLDGPLVFLSACETANGHVLDGEGVLSLSRSFLRAGARATVSTLWPVGRGAVEFSHAFYSNVVQTGDAALALRAAKLSLRRKGLPPTAWAAYQVFAAPAPRSAPASILARSY